ncbi:MAG: hypothetical protein D6737_06840 [Chloroflexi bacterium]|nr:MAG: hypothetical protein D6737_06840 [Chloroflexota bacterium]
MITTTIDITINRPAEAVFAFLSNFENNPKWQSGMQSCQFTTDPPLRVGSRYRQVAKFLGREIVSEFEVVEYEPGRKIKAKTIASSFPIEFMRSVEPIGEATRVHAVITGDPSGFFRLFKPLMAVLVRRSINADYKRLKQLLEAQNA